MAFLHQYGKLRVSGVAHSTEARNVFEHPIVRQDIKISPLRNGRKAVVWSGDRNKDRPGRILLWQGDSGTSNSHASV